MTERNARGKYRQSKEVAEKQARACELREQGLTFKHIAEQLGYAHAAAAQKAVNAALKQIVIPNADQLLRSEISKIEVLDEKMAQLTDNPPVKTTSIGRTQYDVRTCTCNLTDVCPDCSAKRMHAKDCQVKPVLDERIIISAATERRQLSEHLIRMLGYSNLQPDDNAEWKQWAIGVLSESETMVKALRAENDQLRATLLRYESVGVLPAELI